MTMVGNDNAGRMWRRSKIDKVKGQKRMLRLVKKAGIRR